MKPMERVKHTKTGGALSRKKAFKDLYKMEIFGVKNERKCLRFVDRCQTYYERLGSVLDKGQIK